MSNGNSREPADFAPTLVGDARFGIAVLRRNGWSIALLFFLVLLPLWGFGELAGDVHAGEVFSFDRPLLDFAHAHATPALDRLALLLGRIGYLQGVVPFDVALVLFLVFTRKKREGLFAGISAADEERFGRVRELQSRAGVALGAFDPETGLRQLGAGASLHYTGTVRMGPADDGTSVCDVDGAVWGWDGLYVAGNGVIPTAITCNSTLAGMVTAVRTARAALARLA